MFKNQANVNLRGYALVGLPSNANGNPNSLKGHKLSENGTTITPRKISKIKDLTAACFYLRDYEKKHLMPVAITVANYGSITNEKEQHAVFAKSVRKLLDNLIKTTSVNDYLVVYEFQERGLLHAHAILVMDSDYLDVELASRKWTKAARPMVTANNSLRFGTYYKYGSEWRRLFFLTGNPLKSINYLGKYLTKTDARYYCRIYNASYGLSRLIKKYEINAECMQYLHEVNLGDLNASLWSVDMDIVFKEINLQNRIRTILQNNCDTLTEKLLHLRFNGNSPTQLIKQSIMSKLLTLSQGAGEVSVPRVPQYLVMTDTITNIQVVGNESGTIVNLRSANDIAAMCKIQSNNKPQGFNIIQIATGEMNEECTITATGAGAEVVYGFSDTPDGVPFELTSVYVNSGSSVTMDKFFSIDLSNVGVNATASIGYASGQQANLSITEVKSLALQSINQEVAAVVNQDLVMKNVTVNASASGLVPIWRLKF